LAVIAALIIGIAPIKQGVAQTTNEARA
jgi:hypothetical protein